jgi:hypothetical protein
MPQAGFEPTIPVFEREKTVHALDDNKHVFVIYCNALNYCVPENTL